MLEFYYFPEYVRLALAMLSALLAAAQAAVAVAGFHRRRREISVWPENLLETAVLLHCLIFSMMIARVMVNMHSGIAAPDSHAWLRYAALALMLAPAAVCAVQSCFQRRGVLRGAALPLTAVLPAVSTLPFIEDAAGRAFPFIYCAALLCLLARTAYICVLRRRELRRELSGYSVKRAMDALHTGLLFCTADGGIQLINRRMQKLMLAITGRVRRDGNSLWEMLQIGDTLRRPEPAQLDGHPVYRLDDGSVWMFSRNVLPFYGGKYYQISASDVTERWQLTAALRGQEEQLVQRGQELEAALSALESIRRDEELLRVRGKVHDIMAQRLAVLMQALRSPGSVDEGSLTALADDMLTDARIEAEAGGRAGSFRLLRGVFEALGVKITLTGKPPGEPARAAFFADFTREGVTNAVRHGFATEVEVFCQSGDGGLVISVSDNGLAPAGIISEGGGISEIRRRLKKLGGRLEIETGPHFRLTAVIPNTGGENYDQ